VPAADVIDDTILGGAAAARIRRFLRVHGCLAEVLPPAHAARVRAVTLVKGVLTLAVADPVLLSELRNHRQADLLRALAAAGTGTVRLAWRRG
jgi:hypothetical protein